VVTHLQAASGEAAVVAEYFGLDFTCVLNRERRIREKKLIIKN
jgi:hypothetical protein